MKKTKNISYKNLSVQVAGGATGIYRPCGLKPGSVNQLLPNLRLQAMTTF
jgi:hypothetical protein